MFVVDIAYSKCLIHALMPLVSLKSPVLFVFAFVHTPSDMDCACERCQSEIPIANRRRCLTANGAMRMLCAHCAEITSLEFQLHETHAQLAVVREQLARSHRTNDILSRILVQIVRTVSQFAGTVNHQFAEIDDFIQGMRGWR